MLNPDVWYERRHQCTATALRARCKPTIFGKFTLTAQHLHLQSLVPRSTVQLQFTCCFCLSSNGAVARKLLFTISSFNLTNGRRCTRESFAAVALATGKFKGVFFAEENSCADQSKWNSWSRVREVYSILFAYWRRIQMIETLCHLRYISDWMSTNIHRFKWEMYRIHRLHTKYYDHTMFHNVNYDCY